MAFRGINPSLQGKINSWRLPGPVIDKFINGLEPLTRLSPLKLPADSEGMLFVVDVDDFVDPRGGYIFESRISRSDDDFWVSDIICTEVNFSVYCSTYSALAVPHCAVQHVCAYLRRNVRLQFSFKCATENLLKQQKNLPYV